MPSAIHQSIPDFFNRAIGAWQVSLPRDQRLNIYTQSNVEQILSMGSWAGSEKAPDLALKVISNGDVAMKWVLEVGFSQTYQSLRETARL